MACCEPGTALSHLANRLAKREKSDEALPMFFPMYTVTSKFLLAMKEVKAHEELRAEGNLVEFHTNMGKAAFVSHQWVSRQHPDPDGRQLRFLQDALKSIIRKQNIPKDLVTEVFVPKAKSISTADFRRSHLFLWYDYISCPQLETRMPPESGMESIWATQTTNSRLGRAVDSIPAYIAQCSFFFVLCPVIESTDGSHILGPSSWAERGWCRAERTIRELSEIGSYIVIKSSTNLETVATPMTSIGGSPGEGSFTLKEDRRKLCPMVKQALKQKLLAYLQARNIVGYRALLNLQKLHLRGFNTDVLGDLVPGFEADEALGEEVAQFRYQNGFRHINEVDAMGWCPLHYAAMTGEAILIQGLLEQKANLNAKTTRQNPYTGIPPLTTALSISLFFKNLGATRLLLDCGANTSSGIISPLDYVCMGNNPQGIRMLLGSGAVRDRSGLFGFSAIEVACSFGAMAALRELLRQPKPEVSRGLHMAMVFRGGTAEFVNELIELRADVNHQWNEPFFKFHTLYNQLHAMSYIMGKRTTTNMLAYHISGSTPLMNAMISGQYEGAAALIAAGARLDIRNARQVCAADLARQLSVPEFLMQAVEGNLEPCRRIAEVVTSNLTFHI